MKTQLIQQFKDIFGREDGTTYFSPGRVNLIGEHIDYNGGYVFPCALSFGTYGIAAPNKDLTFNVYSNPFSSKIYHFNQDELTKDITASWVDYVKGVIKALLNHGYHLTHGFDLYIEGNMPSGAGLSSSASLESLIVTILDDFNKLNLSIEKKALIGKEAENKFVGVNSGIMDQFAVLAGKKNRALLLNTQTLSYEQIPLELGDYILLIANTNKKRGLADSKYNERFSECQEALSILKPIYLISDLCSLSLKELQTIETLLSPTVYKRVRHVVSEQYRTIESGRALKNDDLVTFGQLMTASHDSLRDDYEVTGIELDTLQQALLNAGAIGARMTGAGFGGCVVAIIKKDLEEDIIKQVTKTYTESIGYEPTFYSVVTENGTHKI